MNQITCVVGIEVNGWVWKLDSFNLFMVKSLYLSLCVKLLPPCILNESICRGLKAKWDSLVPSKVQNFG